MMTTERGVNGVEVLSTMAARNCFFGLDIGTHCDDLAERQSCVEQAIAGITDGKLAAKAREFMYFTAGFWPDVGAIHDRENQMKILRQSIEAASAGGDQDTLNRKIVAVGECGLDHHWNPSGEDGRCESDFDEATYRGEREMFESHLELARELKLPVIVHSRDSFEDSLDCIKNVGYDNGIIHCYSYGIDEARAFLDRGWYIAFGGAVTYNKKAKLEAIKDLLRFVPADRFLCETDAPYLAPVPLRGTTNTPVNVELVYKFIAEVRGTSLEELSNLVDENIKQLFSL
ncbi:TatD DNase family protein [Treponema bryantii]|uniref:TatD DNase family protein n=2 Tax=Treponema bryantii TaxID=163 RepID=A0A1H9EGJ6_9SPIR|nr:TatD DNase family protein [Treponema bryantii]